MDSLLPGFTFADLLIIGALWPLWLTVGKFLIGNAEAYVRYVYGGAGGLLVALILFGRHTEPANTLLWMPMLTVGVGLAWIAVMQLAVAAKDAILLRKAERDARVRAAPLPPKD